MKKQVNVVAAIIENDQREILCALRSSEMSIPNMWEFPGGKIEAGEDLATALKREIQEELGCTIEPGEKFIEITHEYETFILHMICLKSKIIAGTPEPSEHAALLWLKRENLSSLLWAPADIPAVEKLQKEV